MKVSEYLQETLRNPKTRKSIDLFLKIKPPKRKVIVIFDRNVPESFIDIFLTVRWLKKQFKVLGIAIDKLSDEALIKAAQQSGAILITGDDDFWNDKKFRLEDSPGIIILKGRTEKQIIDSFLTALNIIDFVYGIRKFPDYMHGMKIKASSKQINIKFVDYQGKIQKEEISL